MRQFMILTGGRWKVVNTQTCQGERALAALVPDDMTVKEVRQFVHPLVIERDGPIFVLDANYVVKGEGLTMGMVVPIFPGFGGALS